MVLTSNRTAPSVMRIMAMADAARISRVESRSAANGASAGSGEEHLDKTMVELTKLLATTLDALADEQY